MLLFPSDNTFKLTSESKFSILVIRLLKRDKSVRCFNSSNPSIFVILLNDKSKVL